jgi:hypothetical protein
MKKVVVTLSLWAVAAFAMAQQNFNMIWCGSKEAGHGETIALSPECLAEAPRFWDPEMGELKAMGFKMAFVEGNVSTVFTSTTGEMTEEIKAAYKTKSSCNVIQFYDVVISTGVDTYVSDKIYQISYKMK